MFIISALRDSPFARYWYTMGRGSGIYYYSALPEFMLGSLLPLGHIGHIQGGQSDTHQHSVLWTFHRNTCTNLYDTTIKRQSSSISSASPYNPAIWVWSSLYRFSYWTTASLLDCIGRQHVGRHAGNGGERASFLQDTEGVTRSNA